MLPDGERVCVCVCVCVVLVLIQPGCLQPLSLSVNQQLSEQLLVWMIRKHMTAELILEDCRDGGNGVSLGAVQCG